MLEKVKDVIEKIAYIGKVATWCADTLGAAIGSFPVPKSKPSKQPETPVVTDVK
jgi:hypothetical protein